MSIENGCYYCKSCDICDNKDCRVNKQKEEIELLTEEVRHKTEVLSETYSNWYRVNKSNIELQKQVDEFVDVFGNADNFARMMSYLRIKNGHRITTGQELLEWIKYDKQQSVKDTAKEILTEIGQEACEHHYLNSDCEWFNKVCKKYGV